MMNGAGNGTSVAVTTTLPLLPLMLLGSLPTILTFLHQGRGHWFLCWSPCRKSSFKTCKICKTYSNSNLTVRERSTVTPRATSWSQIFLWAYLTLWLYLGRGIQHCSVLIALKFCKCGVLNCNAGARCHPQGLCVLQQALKRDHIKQVSLRRMETSMRSI